MNNSPNFTFDSKNFAHTLKVLAWSMMSAVIAFLIANLNGLSLPPQYVAFVPLVNTLLVALQQYIAAQER